MVLNAEAIVAMSPLRSEAILCDGARRTGGDFDV